MPAGRLNETTLTRILEELKTQGWTLKASPDGLRWQGKPPDPKRKAVLFSARPTDLSGILRQLRDQGFRWPPGTESPSGPSPHIRAVPFPAKPHPEATTDPEPESRPLALVNPPALQTPDEAFARLKEARDYATLAADELGAVRKTFEEAQEALKEAQGIYDDACAALSKAKKAFDDLFDAGSKR